MPTSIPGGNMFGAIPGGWDATTRNMDEEAVVDKAAPPSILLPIILSTTLTLWSDVNVYFNPADYHEEAAAAKRYNIRIAQNRRVEGKRKNNGESGTRRRVINRLSLGAALFDALCREVTPQHLLRRSVAEDVLRAMVILLPMCFNAMCSRVACVVRALLVKQLVDSCVEAHPRLNGELLDQLSLGMLTFRIKAALKEIKAAKQGNNWRSKALSGYGDDYYGAYGGAYRAYSNYSSHPPSRKTGRVSKA